MIWIEKDQMQKRVALTDTDGFITVVDMLTGKRLIYEKIGANWLTCINEEPTERDYLVMGSIDGTIYLSENRMFKKKGVSLKTNFE